MERINLTEKTIFGLIDALKFAAKGAQDSLDVAAIFKAIDVIEQQQLENEELIEKQREFHREIIEANTLLRAWDRVMLRDFSGSVDAMKEMTDVASKTGQFLYGNR